MSDNAVIPASFRAHVVGDQVRGEVRLARKPGAEHRFFGPLLVGVVGFAVGLFGGPIVQIVGFVIAFLGVGGAAVGLVGMVSLPTNLDLGPQGFAIGDQRVGRQELGSASAQGNVLTVERGSETLTWTLHEGHAPEDVAWLAWAIEEGVQESD